MEQTGVARPTIYWLLRREGKQPRGGAARPRDGEVQQTFEWAMQRISDLEQRCAEQEAELRILRQAVASRKTRDN